MCCIITAILLTVLSTTTTFCGDPPKTNGSEPPVKKSSDSGNAYRSANGKFTCTIKRSHFDGSGPATYEVKAADGTTQWKGDHPFTLVHVLITNDGEVIGAGYNRGQIPKETYGKNDPPSLLILAIIGKDGKVRSTSELPRYATNSAMIAAPYVLEVCPIAGQDLVVFAALELGPNNIREQSTWFRLRQSDAKWLDPIAPEEPRAFVSGPVKWASFSKVPALVGEWYLAERSDDPRQWKESGDSICVFSVDGKNVWKLDRPNEFPSSHSFSWYSELTRAGLLVANENRFCIASWEDRKSRRCFQLLSKDGELSVQEYVVPEKPKP